VGLHFSAFITANVLGAVVYVPVIVAAGYGVGYGAGPQVERVLRTLGPVEYVVLTVAVVATGTFFFWRAIRA
jgi:membrane protein DedA with SNARE-associated domain